MMSGKKTTIFWIVMFVLGTIRCVYELVEVNDVTNWIWLILNASILVFEIAMLRLILQEEKEEEEK